MANNIPTRCVAITPSDTGAFVAHNCDSFRVYSAAGCVVRVTPVGAVNDTDTVDLNFGAGTTIEPLSIRRVWLTGTTNTPTVHGYRL